MVFLFYWLLQVQREAAERSVTAASCEQEANSNE